MDIILEKIARTVRGKLVGDGGILIRGVNSLDAAGPGEISFFMGRRYKEELAKTKASALIVRETTDLYKGPQVVVSNPGLAYAKAAWLFAPQVSRHPGVSSKAWVHETSNIGRNVSVYPLVYVGREAVLGDDVILFPGVFVGDRVIIGDRSVIYPNVTILQGCLVGKDVIIHSGTVIGSDGFGFVKDGAVSVKVPQTGIVQIDDQVEIGANNCVDRATFGKTWIKRGVKTDNLVQVAHNVVIGEDTIVVSQAGISGSVHVGREVIIGGQVGVSDHVEIGDGAMVGSQSGIAKSIPAGAVVSGTPGIPHRLWLKASGLMKKLPQMNERLRHLENSIKELEKQLKNKERVR